MSSISEIAPAVSLHVLAGFLLAAGSCLRALDLPHPTAAAVLAATTEATRSSAYEIRDRVLASLPALERAPGRPPKLAAPPPDVAAELTRQALRYVVDHPGAVGRDGARHWYSDGFRRLAVELCERHADLDADVIADAICVPVTTLRQWRRAGASSLPVADAAPAPVHDAAPEPQPETNPAPLRDLHLQTVLDAWCSWRGPFTVFCDQVQRDHHVRIGRTTLATILQLAGERLPTRRRGRSPDEDALRHAFATFFPGAQWTGDGTSVRVAFEGELFVFNLELCVDTDSAAAVGIDVRAHEDAAAVVAAFDDGVATTGAPPVALLLDNKPSNPAPEVDTGIGDTVRMRATISRPQNKAHVEGAFGLFAQVAPPILVDAPTKRERARQVLELQARTCARTLNHRPRRGRDGRSRFQLYRDAAPSEQDVARPREALVARAREQGRARDTARARQNPATRRFLDDAFSKLALDDPEHQLKNAIARYPLDRIVEGVAVFAGKRTNNSLPEGVDARYLLGIVRNIAEEHEGMAVATHLWDLRMQARDLVFAPLRARLDDLEQGGDIDVNQRVRMLVDPALATDRTVERHFWITCTADTIVARDAAEHRGLLLIAARRIHATQRVPHADRLRATRLLAREAASDRMTVSHDQRPRPLQHAHTAREQRLPVCIILEAAEARSATLRCATPPPLRRRPEFRDGGCLTTARRARPSPRRSAVP